MPAPKRPAAHSYSSAGSIFGTQRYRMEKRVAQLMGPDRPLSSRRNPPSIQVTESGSTVSSPHSSPQKTSVSQFLVRDDSGQRSIMSLESKPSIASMTEYEPSEHSDNSIDAKINGQPSGHQAQAQAQQPSGSHETPQPDSTETGSQGPSYTAERLSGLSDRSVEPPHTQEAPSMSEKPKYDDEPYDFSKLEPRPKIKLGPRPVAPGKEPKRSAVTGVAPVPAAIRPASKKPESSRPKSQGPVNAPVQPVPAMAPRPPPIPDVPEYAPRPVSRGSVRSAPSHKSSTMTPDKIRLMKAVELRKKQLRKSNPQPSTFAPPQDLVPAVPRVPEPSEREVAKSLEAAENRLDDESHVASNKADSGIELAYEKQQQERREETSQREEILEEPREELKDTEAEPSTSAQLQPSASSAPHRESLKLDTSRPQSTAPEDAAARAEPTVSLDMLEDPPRPSFPWMQDDQHADSPTLGRSSLGLHDSRAPAEETTRLPAISTTPSSRPVSPLAPQPATYRPTGADRAEQERSRDEVMMNHDSPETGPESPRRNQGDLAKRRRGLVEPLHMDAPPDLELSSNDEALDELRSADFQDAQPVNMAKSPLSPGFPRQPSTHSVVSNGSNPSVRSINIRRSSTNLLDQFDADAAPGRSQSVTTPNVERSESASSLRRNVSTGITKRIQALSEHSSRETSPNNAPRQWSPSSDSAPTWRDRKTAVRSPPRTNRGSFRRQSGRATPVAQHPEPVWNVQNDPSSHRDSVSVTARIVRPPPGQDLGGNSIDGQLHHSPLTVNHKRASAHLLTQPNGLPPLHTSSAPKSSEPSTPAASTPPPATDHRHFHSAPRPSFGSRHRHPTSSPATPSVDDFPPPPTTRTSYTSSHVDDSASASTAAGTSKEGSSSGSRASRFFKRMSNLGGGGGGGAHKRRVSGQNVLSVMSSLDVSSHHQAGAGSNGGNGSGGAARAAKRNSSGGAGTTTETTTEPNDLPPPVVLGDLNVQFPDTLVSPTLPPPSITNPSARS